jgi:hypothetical protein
MLVFVVNIYSLFCRLYGSISARLGYLIETGVKGGSSNYSTQYHTYILAA